MISHPYRRAYVLPDELLPPNFLFPASYVDFSRQGMPLVGLSHFE